MTCFREPVRPQAFSGRAEPRIAVVIAALGTESRSEGVDYAVLEAFVQYRQPLHFDDLVTVHLAVASATRATFQMSYLLTVGGEVRSTAVTVHGCVNAQGKPVRMPEWLRAMVTSQPAP